MPSPFTFHTARPLRLLPVTIEAAPDLNILDASARAPEDYRLTVANDTLGACVLPIQLQGEGKGLANGCLLARRWRWRRTTERPCA